ncbi:hypothetical protein [Amycolatopsis sp. H20-H5]|uniref:hypothetical protein n=1 Tax=Amycolatopsis sp. H20-H5 TaxID=3046309 RepID=UPI002DBED6F2|nr:hypothetical protein [Amycolatopsis sp. H20-H5]MEC3977948.1 hypothetical protein [Amycolatopsis sp. H20-H5]
MAGNATPPPSFWRKVPVDPAYDHWLTVGFERKVLVVDRTVTPLTRLLDILSLFEGDRRIQIVFTFDAERPGILSAGVADALRANAVVSWEEAVKTRFDLAIAASENDALHELDAPILLVPHGIGYQKYYPGGQVTSGMDPAKLVRHGEVVPSAIALSHSVQRDQLRAACPEAVGRAVVVGDPCHDRMLVSRHRVARYRAALGTGARALVVLTSTWGPNSLFGRHPDLPRLLLGELPLDEYQLAVSLHPGVWAGHSSWQIESWLSPELRAGLVLIPPDHGWQATILAADCVISDEGSAALYAAAVDKPLLLAATSSTTTVSDSPLAALVRSVPALRASGLREQVDAVIAEHRAGAHDAVVIQAVEDPGNCARLLGDLLYDSLDLSRPAEPARFPPVPDPTPLSAPVAAMVAGLDAAGELVRFPASVHPELRFSHIVAHADHAELHELDGAAIVYTDDESRLGELLAHWPMARLAAAPVPGGCSIRLPGGKTSFLPSADEDPLRLASFAYLKLATNQNVTAS